MAGVKVSYWRGVSAFAGGLPALEGLVAVESLEVNNTSQLLSVWPSGATVAHVQAVDGAVGLAAAAAPNAAALAHFIPAGGSILIGVSNPPIRFAAINGVLVDE